MAFVGYFTHRIMSWRAGRVCPKELVACMLTGSKESREMSASLHKSGGQGEANAPPPPSALPGNVHDRGFWRAGQEKGYAFRACARRAEVELSMRPPVCPECAGVLIAHLNCALRACEPRVCVCHLRAETCTHSVSSSFARARTAAAKSEEEGRVRRNRVFHPHAPRYAGA